MAGEHRELRVGRADFLKHTDCRRRRALRELGIREHFEDDALRARDIRVLEALRGRLRAAAATAPAAPARPDIRASCCLRTAISPAIDASDRENAPPSPATAAAIRWRRMNLRS